SAFDKKVRSILVKRGLISEQKVDEIANAVPDTETKSLADVLVERGSVPEGELLSSIALELNVPPLDVEKVDFEERAIKTLTQELASYYCVMPVARIGNVLTLAVANPFDVLKLDDLRLVTECEIRPVVSMEKAIRKAIQKGYNPGEQEMTNLLEKGDTTDLEVKEKVEDEMVDLTSISGSESESPIVKLVNMMIAQAIKDRASDIHIEAYEKKIRVRNRVDGALHDTISPPRKMLSAIVSRIKIMSSLDIAERRIPQDGKFQMKYEGRQIDFRVSILPMIHGEKVVMRILDSSSLALSLEVLGFEKQALDAFRKAVNAAYGMILVTGPTGSGKSTTLYSAVKEVITPEENITTVEDPVEYQMDGVNQVPVNEKTGLTFAAALRSILRQDPDTVMIGEIRDFETADIAVKAAITGHLVLSTLHTNDAPSSIARLVDMGVDPFMVASSVILIGAQRLGRKLCENCKQPLEGIPPERLIGLGVKPEEIATAKIFKPVGCGRCKNGYKGRFAILEALEIDDEMRKIIIKGGGAMAIKEYAVKEKGMITLRRCALLNTMRGRTSLEEVIGMTMQD
ncbi:MAG: ATPase, T2SS/T4P/T4SS family, partial [Planctomycetota bacterium]|nr:ATPase, T2SS/T4P/T4SS family [Planctomycetota bacterium]